MATNTLLNNNQCVKEETIKKIRKYFKVNENGNTSQNLWNTEKTVCREKFINVNVYIRQSRIQAKNH